MKLRRALYGEKQSASPLHSCFYRWSDALLILYCDDLRIGASKAVLDRLHESTTAAGTRFLGMDTIYDHGLRVLKLSMTTYIETKVARFESFDLSQGYPHRELVGRLLWVTLSVMGPELLRVKDLARRLNSFGESNYRDALKERSSTNLGKTIS